MNNFNKIIERIIYLRKQVEMSQATVAKQIGLSRQSWIAVEKGERDLSLTELGKFADIFGMDVTEFFEDIPHIKKFKEMYFACIKFGADSDGNISIGKLSGLLYLADFTNYYQNNESISGIRYRAMYSGPKSEVFFSATEDLYNSGVIEITPTGQELVIQSRIGDRKPEWLTKPEIALIRQICHAWQDRRASEITHFTNEQIAHGKFRDGEYMTCDFIKQEAPGHIYQPY